jgi:gluconolactonase
MNRLLAVLLSLPVALGCAPSSGSTRPLPPQGPGPTLGSIERKDKRLDVLLPSDARMEILAGGFDWTEGPVWVKDGGYLLFSVIPPNKVNKWKEGEGVSIFLKPSGYTGERDLRYEPGSNGLALDQQGKLILCQHGDRRVARMAAPLSKPEAKFETLADRWQGKRFNSPNDLVWHSSGALYFTDPPYGLAKQMEDPSKELDFQGVYRLGADGAVTLLTKEVTRPNGIAFSPDEKTLYVASSDPKKAVWHAFPVKADGTLGDGRIFADFTAQVGKVKGLPDGLKVDEKGNLWATGPGGVLIFAPDGSHLGTLRTGEATSNCAWGEDGATLFITADQYLVRIRTWTKGARY